MNDVIISTHAVRKEFNGLVAVDNVDYEIRENETAGIIGPNGAGKSTFFNLLTGYFIPDAGTISYFGKEITQMAPYDRVHLGIVRTFQLVSVLDNLSVMENIMLARIRFDASYRVRERFFLKSLLKS